MVDIDFPKLIKMLRRKNKLSQQKFADKIDVSIKTVQSWEYSYADPSRANMQTIIDKFGLKEEDYPELFEYVSRPHAKNEADDVKAGEGANDSAEENGEDGRPLLKRIFNAPLKIIILIVIAVIVEVGVFFGIYTILSIFIAYSDIVKIIISVVCATAIVVAAMLLVYFLAIKKRKK